MTNVIAVGLQWGDEGKGKIVDFLGERAHCVVRFGGGANAGHTLIVDGERVVFHLLPSGMLRRDCRCVMASGMVVDPDELVTEIDKCIGLGLLSDATRLRISAGAHLVLPHHKALDALREQGEGSLGTTLRGIGPAYEDRVGRRGVWMGLLLDTDRFRRALSPALGRANVFLTHRGKEAVRLEDVVDKAKRWGDALAPYIGDTEIAIQEEIERRNNVLFEGAQGSLLDIGFGTYPYVTSSATVAGGACVGAGVGPSKIHSVVGVVKAYTTRVGEGPFPTECRGEEGDLLRAQGGEVGATTGRPRRCGWLDLPALKRTIMVNGIDGLAVTKLDVLSGLAEIPVCEAYEINGTRLDRYPSDPDVVSQARPVYGKRPGWSEDLTGCRSLDELPSSARDYLGFMEEELGVPIYLVSLGPERNQSIVVRNAFFEKEANGPG